MTGGNQGRYGAFESLGYCRPLKAKNNIQVERGMAERVTYIWEFLEPRRSYAIAIEGNVYERRLISVLFFCAI